MFDSDNGRASFIPAVPNVANVSTVLRASATSVTPLVTASSCSSLDDLESAHAPLSTSHCPAPSAGGVPSTVTANRYTAIVSTAASVITSPALTTPLAVHSGLLSTPGPSSTRSGKYDDTNRPALSSPLRSVTAAGVATHRCGVKHPASAEMLCSTEQFTGPTITQSKLAPVKACS